MTNDTTATDFDPSLIELDIPAPTMRQVIPTIPSSDPLGGAARRADYAAASKASAVPVAARRHTAGCTLAPNHEGVCYVRPARPSATQRQVIPTTVPQRTAASDAIGAELGVQQLGSGQRTTLQTAQTLRTQTAQLVTTTVVQPEAPALKKGDIVAGAAAEGHGVLLGFSGRGQLTRAQLLATLVGAGFPAEWAPSTKTAHAHAGRVVGALNVLGYIARADRTKSQRRSAREAIPTWSARWHVSRTGRAADVGSASGTVVAVVTLDASGSLDVRTDAEHEHLSSRIATDFTALVQGEIYAAADVSAWLKSTLVTKLRAAQLGGNWYVKREHAASAEKLLSAFASIWGENFLLPALPVASSAQLRAGIALSFAREVEAVLDTYRVAKTAAVEDKKTISHRLSLSIHGDLRALTERCIGYAALLGSVHVESLRTRIVAASEEIEQTIDGLSQRFGHIFDELRRDAERAGGAK